MKTKIVCFVGICIYLLSISSCSKTKSPYCIIGHDTIAFLLDRNDISMIAEIEYWKHDEKDDSIITRLYDYYSLKGYKTLIRPYKANPNDTIYTRDYRFILDGSMDTTAFLIDRLSNYKSGFVITRKAIQDKNELLEILNAFDLYQAKFYTRYNYWDTNSMDYYAVYNFNDVTFYEKPFMEDTLRVFNYFIDAFSYMKDSYDRLYTKENILKCVFAIRDMGELAKRYKFDTNLKDVAANLIDSLEYYQSMYLFNLRETYCKILERDISNFHPKKVHYYNDSKELYLESYYFVSRNNCLKVHFEHCHIWPYLGIRTVRFNWSMMEKYDHVFPVLPKGSIHAINHIGWLRSANQEVDLYSTVKNLKGIVDLSLYFE